MLPLTLGKVLIPPRLLLLPLSVLLPMRYASVGLS